MFSENFLEMAMIRIPVIVFSLTVHEFFHAWSAYKLGDATAARMGRMTLNPLKHLDFLGTAVMVFSGFRFGWAKPVPVNVYNLGNPRRDHIWVSAAGPLSNIGIAFIAGMLMRTIGGLSLEVPPGLFSMLNEFVYINLILAFFNLIPLFPLDGSHILRNLLPPQYEESFARFDRIAPFVVLLLLVTNVIWIVLGPPLFMLYRLFSGQ